VKARHLFFFAALGTQGAAIHAQSSWDCTEGAPPSACGGLELFAANATGIGGTVAAPDPYRPISAWTVCPPQPLQEFTPASPLSKRADAVTNLAGDMATRDSDGTLVLIGNAEAERADQRIKADRLVYIERDGIVNVEGQVRYDEPQMTIRGSHGTMWLDENRGELHDTFFRFYDRHARGDARTSYLVEPGITRYDKVSYTTCADDSNVWKLRASSVTLYKEEGEGVARNARLNIQGVPVLYTPYLSFPIDDRRKTGFLVPSFGSSDNSGFELRVPYYINLAPNYDATLTPRYLQDRGTQLNADFRYLRHKQEGFIKAEYLPDDALADKNRSRFTFRDTSRFGNHFITNINYDWVSDSDYVTDLGDSLSLASVTHLPRSFSADYNTNWWRAGLRVDDYQTIDKTIAPANRPYERLPRLTFSGTSPAQPFGLETGLSSEFVRFDQDTRVTGNRVDLQPNLRFPIRRTAFETTPKLGVRYTSYQLNNADPEQTTHPSRTTPVFSLDNVLFLERDMRVGSRSYTQTLEPRLFYLYVRGQNQDDIPLFDTSEPTFTYRELFEENRFNGADRMGDANQLALALTTRVLDPATGEEKIRASAGQLFYFGNRNVTLPDTQADDSNQSDIAGELDVILSRAWQGKADLILNQQDQKTERANARIQYHPGFRKIANVSYRYRREEQDQVDASILWPLTPSWQVLGRWYYDIDSSKKLETMVGIEYDSCCWGIRLVGREFVNSDSTENNSSDSTETNRAIMVQFVLKGLAHIGSDIESLLEDGILGYTERPED